MKKLCHSVLCASMFCLPFAVLLLLYYCFHAPDDVLATSIDVVGKTHFVIGGNNQSHERSAASAHPVYCEPLASNNLLCSDGSVCHALFSPDDDVQEILLNLIAREQEEIRIAVFSFTDGKIAQQLIDATRRGVKVSLVTDSSGFNDRFNKITILKESGIPVYIYAPQSKSLLSPIMHNKFVVFAKNIANKSLLWTGSFNFTQSAYKRNQENVVLLDDQKLIKRYLDHFELLKERSAKKEEIELKKS